MSQERTGRVWTHVRDVDETRIGETVTLRGRVHAVRGKGKSAFLVLRQQTTTIQCVFFVDDVNVSKGMVKYVSNLTKESVVDIVGSVAKPEEGPVLSCTQTDVEMAPTSIRCISRSVPVLPFQIDDAARSETAFEADDSTYVRVGQDTRLNHRVIDLRTPANQAIFRVQSAVCELFRDALRQRDFVEIHTPKLIGGASEGGASVFKLDYMGQPACVAQSPQLYKQMAVESDLERVFEIGPVFRAEDSNTHRHLCEFTGLDMELAIKEHYVEVLDVLDALFLHMFDGLNERFGHELNVVAQQYPYEPLKYLRPTLRLEFPEGIKMLQDAGVEDVDPLGDLSTAQERTLGELVKKKYDTDFYILHKYPAGARPFYTMPDPSNPDYSNSFDIFIRGEEIIRRGPTTWIAHETSAEAGSKCHHPGVPRRVQVRRASPRRVRRRSRARRHAVPGAGEHPKDEHVPARPAAFGAVARQETTVLTERKGGGAGARRSSTSTTYDLDYEQPSTSSHFLLRK